MNKQAPAIQAFEEYAQKRLWHYARNTERGIAASPALLDILGDFFIAGAVWGKEAQRKAVKPRTPKGRKP